MNIALNIFGLQVNIHCLYVNIVCLQVNIALNIVCLQAQGDIGLNIDKKTYSGQCTALGRSTTCFDDTSDKNDQPVKPVRGKLRKFDLSSNRNFLK